MPGKPADKLVIRGGKPLKALSAPQRIQILEILLGGAALSIREVAAKAGRPPAALYHHFAQLESAGLIASAGVRGEGRRAERVYRPVARAVQAAPPRTSTERDELARAGEAQARYALRRFSRAVRSGGQAAQGAARTVALRHLSLCVTPDRLRALNDDIEALTRKWAQVSRDEQGTKLSLLLVMAPESA